MFDFIKTFLREKTDMMKRQLEDLQENFNMDVIRENVEDIINL